MSKIYQVCVSQTAMHYLWADSPEHARQLVRDRVDQNARRNDTFTINWVEEHPELQDVLSLLGGRAHG